MNHNPQYSVMCIDPPWPKRKGGLRKIRPNQSRKLDYETLSIERIFEILDNEIFPMATEKHTVFLWSIDQFLHDAEASMKQRGYKLHARLIWDKENGVAPAFSVRYTHEYVTWWYKPRFTPVANNARGKLTTVFREPARQHSRKPIAFYKAVETWFPLEAKIDVFSRQNRHGWAQWGNQIDHFNTSLQTPKFTP